MNRIFFGIPLLLLVMLRGTAGLILLDSFALEEYALICSFFPSLYDISVSISGSHHRQFPNSPFTAIVVELIS